MFETEIEDFKESDSAFETEKTSSADCLPDWHWYFTVRIRLILVDSFFPFKKA